MGLQIQVLNQHLWFGCPLNNGYFFLLLSSPQINRLQWLHFSLLINLLSKFPGTGALPRKSCWLVIYHSCILLVSWSSVLFSVKVRIFHYLMKSFYSKKKAISSSVYFSDIDSMDFWIISMHLWLLSFSSSKNITSNIQSSNAA